MPGCASQACGDRQRRARVGAAIYDVDWRSVLWAMIWDHLVWRGKPTIEALADADAALLI